MQLLLSITVTAGFCAVVLGIVSWIVFVIGIKASSGKNMVFGKGRSAKNGTTVNYEWMDDICEVSIGLDDRVCLCGYAFCGHTRANWIICIHGYSGCASNMADYMDHFIGQGYNVLAIDLRGHGRSGGAYYGLGVLDQKDILKWVQYLEDVSPESSVILFGISMGGAAALMTGASAQGSVSGVISDSAPSDFVSMFRRILSGKLYFLTEPVIGLVSIYTRILAGYWLRSASALDSIRRIAVPVLLIHGETDGFVPSSNMDALFEACQAQREKYLCPNADHTKALRTNPEAYWGIVDRFLQQHGNQYGGIKSQQG
jgi:pimeloyl-ACP methyl ester carboxylesterase